MTKVNCDVCNKMKDSKKVKQCTLCGEWQCQDCGKFNEDGVCVTCMELIQMDEVAYELSEV